MLTSFNSSGKWQTSFVPHSADLPLCQALFTATSRPGTVLISCDKWSPVTEPKWSTGQPSVALIHIFCGQINEDVAEGFHSRSGNQDPSCAKA